MGAKLSKGLPNPCGCWPRRRKKSKVVPIGLCSLGVADNNATVDSDPTSLSALLRPANPAVRLGWRSDLVLEDVDIEIETGAMALPVRGLPLPPVIPPPRMRAPALEVPTPKLCHQADIPGFVQDTGIDESEVQQYYDNRIKSDCCIFFIFRVEKDFKVMAQP